MAGKERNTAMRQRREEKEAAPPLRYGCLEWRSVVFLVKLSRFTHRPSSPAVLPGVNNCLHLVGLPNKRATERKKERKTPSIM